MCLRDSGGARASGSASVSASASGSGSVSGSVSASVSASVGASVSASVGASVSASVSASGSRFSGSRFRGRLIGIAVGAEMAQPVLLGFQVFTVVIVDLDLVGFAAGHFDAVVFKPLNLAWVVRHQGHRTDA
jgi:hypothetical protein